MYLPTRTLTKPNYAGERNGDVAESDTPISRIEIHEHIISKLNTFYESRKIPHLIFHGSSGSGKKTLVHNFINKIYGNDKQKIKSNVMFVNCAHGKGIKFIREELKFFAKTNIQFNSGILFKTIILLNADNLTIDAQSALRRCIELFSYNTRFFIIVENKHKLLNPILSRFCEIYVPEYICKATNKIVNLHQYNISAAFQFNSIEEKNKQCIERHIGSASPHPVSIEGSPVIPRKTHAEWADVATILYENGISCMDLVRWIENSNKWNGEQLSEIFMCFHKIKSEFRCEKLLMFYLLDFVFLRSNKDLKSISEM